MVSNEIKGLSLRASDVPSYDILLFALSFRFAYAGVGAWYSVFNDDACNFVSAQMHGT